MISRVHQAKDFFSFGLQLFSSAVLVAIYRSFPRSILPFIFSRDHLGLVATRVQSGEENHQQPLPIQPP